MAAPDVSLIWAKMSSIHWVISASERTLVRPHRDALARVTVVVELQPADGSSPAAAAKAGGLFIQKSEDSNVSMVPLRAGDAFLHDYSLMHVFQLSPAIFIVFVACTIPNSRSDVGVFT